MAEGSTSKPCAAHNCLKTRYKEGWCAAHWYAHTARLVLQLEPVGNPDSLAICEAIWDAS